jgi:hypothetical protein
LARPAGNLCVELRAALDGVEREAGDVTVGDLEGPCSIEMIRRLRPARRQLGARLVLRVMPARQIYFFETGVMVPNNPLVSSLGPAVK